MAYRTGTAGNDVENMGTWGAPANGANAHQYDGLAGDDTVYGSAYIDTIIGGLGNDTLYGNGGDDALIGNNGNDRLYGGIGNDFLAGGSGDAGADLLDGGAGNDVMYGGPGNDTYIHGLGGGFDIINDGKSEAANTGYGGGTDIIRFTGIKLADLAYAHPAGTNDLWLAGLSDFADGVIDDGVKIEDFYTNNANTTIEWLITADGYQINLLQLM